MMYFMQERKADVTVMTDIISDKVGSMQLDMISVLLSL